MVINCTDGQIVGESEATLFTMLQQGPMSGLIMLKNSGVNTMNYRFQEWNGSAWVDLGASGSDLYNTLSPNQVRQMLVESSYPQVQLVGNASGGSFLDFSVTRYANRTSGGSLPILSL